MQHALPAPQYNMQQPPQQTPALPAPPQYMKQSAPPPQARAQAPGEDYFTPYQRLDNRKFYMTPIMQKIDALSKQYPTAQEMLKALCADIWNYDSGFLTVAKQIWDESALVAQENEKRQAADLGSLFQRMEDMHINFEEQTKHVTNSQRRVKSWFAFNNTQYKNSEDFSGTILEYAHRSESEIKSKLIASNAKLQKYYDSYTKIMEKVPELVRESYALEVLLQQKQEKGKIKQDLKREKAHMTRKHTQEKHQFEAHQFEEMQRAEIRIGEQKGFPSPATNWKYAGGIKISDKQQRKHTCRN